jgi:hypothetical protein
VQNLRKQAGLDIADRITLSLNTTSPALQAAIEQFGAYIQQETLAVELVTAPLDGQIAQPDVSIDGQAVRIGLVKANVD